MSWGSQARALLVGVHLLAIGLKALPAPEGAMAKKDWAHPTVQAEFKQWSQQLNHLGLDTKPQQLEAQLWTLATRVTGVRNQMLRPFRPYYHYFGADQNWRLFVAPHMFPSRLEIDILEDQDWKPIYRVHSEHKWMQPLIENGRFRPAIFRYSWQRYKGANNQFVLYLSKQVGIDYPNASQIRVRWWRYKLPSHTDILNDISLKGTYHSTLQYPVLYSQKVP